ncbi:MAG TPA: phosphoglycerate kinase [Candidatus Nanoarchaeia archaeon]|nr:phosphoglycerate kinase [Candidatus Nanoarchaeia archaeon]
MVLQGLKTLSDINVAGKRVLLRLDLNSDIRKGRLIPSERLTAPLETIRELKRKGAKIVIIAHQGRPDSKFHDFISLKQHARYMNNFLKIKFIDDVIGIKTIKAIAVMKSGEVILLENVRFVPDELNYSKERQNKLITQLAPLFDLYINDAFSASHREHASIVGFPRALPSAIGRAFEKELEAVKSLHINNALLVLGGSKPEDNVRLLQKTKNKVLASGLFGPFCLMALGKNLGKQNKIMHDSLKKYGSIIKQNKNKIILPADLAIEQKGKRRDMKIDEFPLNEEIFDLGIETIERYAREIMNAKAVFFKGLAGLCSTPAFSVGTEALLRALTLCKGFTVVSGGHTQTMIEKLKIPKNKFGYVSLSGGALIHYLAEGTLPGIEAIFQ